MLLALALALSIPQASAAPLSPPAECVKAARDFTAAQRKAQSSPTSPLTRAIVDKIEADKKEMAKACAAKIDVAKLNAAGFLDMVELYGETGEADKASATLAAALARTDLTPDVRGNALLQAVLAGLREPKGDERNARLEKIVDQLDALRPVTPGIFDAQFAAHYRMNNYYRGDDIDAGIIKHSTWIINSAKSFTAQQHAQLDRQVVSAHINMAEAFAGQGMNDKAMALLTDAQLKYPALAATADIGIEIERYKLVGLPAAAIAAPAWFNGPSGKNLGFDGKVTLLEFTAHWCGPCRESYPGINRLRAKYGSQGFGVAMVTRLYGYFGSEQGVAPAAEIAKDKDYFKDHELADIPVAIGNKVDVKVVNGKVEYIPAMDPNDVAYHVTGIPQIMIIDKQGKIRLIMVGYDDVNEPRLAKMIEDLLKEK